MKIRSLAWTALAAILSSAAWASPFDDFVLNGDADLIDSGNVLRVAPTGGFRSGSAFVGTPFEVSAGTSFSAAFSFRIQDGSAADGLTFVVQNDAAGANALGANGGYLGYEGITPSLAVVFDTWDNSYPSDPQGENISIVTGGELTTPTGPAIPLDAADPPLRGGIRYVWVDYASTNGTVSVYYSDQATRPATAFVEGDGFDLDGMLGNQMYVGFTAATGGSDDNHDVLSWQFETLAAVPEPQTYALFGAGLVLLGLGVARRGTSRKTVRLR